MAGKLEFNGPIVNAGQAETEAYIPTTVFHGQPYSGALATSTGSLPVDAVQLALGRGGNDHDADDGVL